MQLKKRRQMLGGREGGKSRDSEEQREKGREEAGRETEGQEVKRGEGEPGREKAGKRQRETFQSL